jgi:hypothetical protein
LIEGVGKQSRRNKGRVLTAAGKKPVGKLLLTICQPVVGSCPYLGEWWGQRCHTQASDVGYVANIVAKYEQRV